MQANLVYHWEPKKEETVERERNKNRNGYVRQKNKYFQKVLAQKSHSHSFVLSRLLLATMTEADVKEMRPLQLLCVAEGRLWVDVAK